MIRRINKQSLFLLLPLSLLSALIDWKKLPVSIIVGGAVALVNLKGLHWGLSALINPETAPYAMGRLVFFSLFRLLVAFSILGILLYLRLVNVVGVLAGITVVFVIIMKEGLTEARKL
jgi:hypothetical protein